MALNKQNAAPKFEDPEAGDGFPGGDGDDDGSQEVREAPVEETRALSGKERAALAAQAYAADQAAQTKAAEKVEPVKTTALAAKGGSAVAINKMADLNPYPGLQDQFRVKFNTLPQIQANQGSFFLRDGEKSMGDTITLEIISFQYLWALTPGDVDDPKAKEFLRYSDDGITAENGDDMKEILALAKANGFPKAKIQERIVMVGSLVDAGKLHKSMNEKPVQIDLAPSSVGNFKAFQLEVAHKIFKQKTPEGFDPTILKLHAKAKSAGNMKWTEVEFGTADHEFAD